MTYCVALKITAGLVMLSDTRTNAGVDNISRYRKSFTYELPGQRAMCVQTAGNLSITQAILTRISASIQRANHGEDVETILNCPTLFRSAELVGGYMREQQDLHRIPLMNQGIGSEAGILLAGQKADGQPRLYMIYSPGNFIEATPDTPFFQIGENKYGKPILDRMIRMETPLKDALKAVFLSMDSTIKSNLSVGLPLDLVVIPHGEPRFSVQRRIEPDDEDWRGISAGWAKALETSFEKIPEVRV